MTTALDLIADSLLELGVIAVGETPSSDDSTVGLNALNFMIDGWNTQNLAIYTSVDATYTFSPGQATYTIGPAGNFNGARPVSFTSMYVRYQGVDFPVVQIDQDTYNLIPLKTQPGILPEIVNFSPNYPLASMTFWPVPTQAIQVIFSANSLLSGFATLTTAFAFPPGYYRAMRSNLVVELAGKYGKALTPGQIKIAATSLGDVRRLNKRTPISRFDDALFDTQSTSYTRIIAGY